MTSRDLDFSSGTAAPRAEPITDSAPGFGERWRSGLWPHGPSTWIGRRSIAMRLFLSATFWSTAILLVAGLILSAVNRSASQQDFDERLGVYQRALVAELAASGQEQRADIGELGEPMFDLPLSGWYWQVTRLDADRPEVHASRSLFAERLPKLVDVEGESGPGGARKGFVQGPDDRRLRLIERLIDAGDQGRFLIQVAASPEEIEVDVSRFDLSLGATFSLLALALVASTALQVRFGLRPLRQLQEGVAAIRRGEGEHIAGDFPRDIHPLASELNLLIASNKEIVERARTHVGNLAHALKTPLSVILNEAEAQARQPGAAVLADRVTEQAGIMRDQVGYYLDRARAAARSSMIGTATDAKPVIDALTRTFTKIYADRGVTFAAEAPAGLRFRGERQDLEDMIGNLVDNAGKWARSHVAIAAAFAEEASGAGLAIVVDDDGPGLPADQRATVTRRGRRMDETKPGSGLGLSIVADLVGVYGGALTLSDSPLGGLRAILRLP